MLKLKEYKQIIEPITNETKVSNEVIEKAYQTNIQDLIQSIWSLISNLNSSLATIELDYMGENKNEITNILSGINDDLTMDIGMLHKVNELIDNKNDELIELGKQKAEEIANNN